MELPDAEKAPGDLYRLNTYINIYYLDNKIMFFIPGTRACFSILMIFTI
jgi:hypothetical protein